MTTAATAAAAAAAAAASGEATNSKALKHKRRYCRAHGCTRIVKSQGLCQRHGAKPRKCRVEGCNKQAQGNFDGMCKACFKAYKKATTPIAVDQEMQQQAAMAGSGESVYEKILPECISWKPNSGTEMPLIHHLREGFEENKPPAWHRNEERISRGLFPVLNAATQLEDWERELVWTEILLLTGNANASFRHLARGWGRDKGFHMVIAQFICERHGDFERKRRERASAGSVTNESNGDESGNDYVGAEVWDDACYGDTAYNEALAADLLNIPSSPGKNVRGLSDSSFLFKEDLESDGYVNSSGDEALSSSQEGGTADSNAFSI